MVRYCVDCLSILVYLMFSRYYTWVWEKNTTDVKCSFSPHHIRGSMISHNFITSDFFNIQFYDYSFII